MRVIALWRLREFWQQPGREHAEQPLRAWYREAKKAKWPGPAVIKAQYRNASFLKDNRVVFNIAGNKYRLIVRLLYRSQIAYIRFVGTHAEYDDVDAAKI
jgi:mRNA interferase HigB